MCPFRDPAVPLRPQVPPGEATGLLGTDGGLLLLSTAGAKLVGEQGVVAEAEMPAADRQEEEEEAWSLPGAACWLGAGRALVLGAGGAASLAQCRDRTLSLEPLVLGLDGHASVSFLSARPETGSEVWRVVLGDTFTGLTLSASLRLAPPTLGDAVLHCAAQDPVTDERLLAGPHAGPGPGSVLLQCCGRAPAGVLRRGLHAARVNSQTRSHVSLEGASRVFYLGPLPTGCVPDDQVLGWLASWDVGAQTRLLCIPATRLTALGDLMAEDSLVNSINRDMLAAAASAGPVSLLPPSALGLHGEGATVLCRRLSAADPSLLLQVAGSSVRVVRTDLPGKPLGTLALPGPALHADVVPEARTAVVAVGRSLLGVRYSAPGPGGCSLAQGFELGLETDVSCLSLLPLPAGLHIAAGQWIQNQVVVLPFSTEGPGEPWVVGPLAGGQPRAIAALQGPHNTDWLLVGSSSGYLEVFEVDWKLRSARSVLQAALGSLPVQLLPGTGAVMAASGAGFVVSPDAKGVVRVVPVLGMDSVSLLVDPTGAATGSVATFSLSTDRFLAEVPHPPWLVVQAWRCRGS